MGKWDAKELSHLYHSEGKTLREIADIFGVSHERIRQVMATLDISRVKNRKHKVHKSPFFNLGDYLARGKDLNATMWKFLPDGLVCGECGSSKHLHIHHIQYPARLIDDIQILCATCHKIKHNKALSYAQQIDIFRAYSSGVSRAKLARQYGVNWWIINNIIHKFQK